MHFKHQGIRQFADVVKTPLGPSAFDTSDASFVQGNDQADSNASTTSTDAETAALCLATNFVVRYQAPSLRAAPECSPDAAGCPLGDRLPMDSDGRLFLQSHEQDVVDVATELFAELSRVSLL